MSKYSKWGLSVNIEIVFNFCLLPCSKWFGMFLLLFLYMSCTILRFIILWCYRYYNILVVILYLNKKITLLVKIWFGRLSQYILSFCAHAFAMLLYAKFHYWVAYLTMRYYEIFLANRTWLNWHCMISLLCFKRFFSLLLSLAWVCRTLWTRVA